MKSIKSTMAEEILGSGSFGEVYAVDEYRVVKRVLIPAELVNPTEDEQEELEITKARVISAYYNEVIVMTRLLDVPNVCKIISYDESDYSLVMERHQVAMTNVDTQLIIDNFDEILRQVVIIVASMHTNYVHHNDISARNFMLDGVNKANNRILTTPAITVIDFGVSNLIDVYKHKLPHVIAQSIRDEGVRIVMMMVFLVFGVDVYSELMYYAIYDMDEPNAKRMFEKYSSIRPRRDSKYHQPAPVQEYLDTYLPNNNISDLSIEVLNRLINLKELDRNDTDTKVVMRICNEFYGTEFYYKEEKKIYPRENHINKNNHMLCQVGDRLFKIADGELECYQAPETPKYDVINKAGILLVKDFKKNHYVKIAENVTFFYMSGNENNVYFISKDEVFIVDILQFLEE